MIGLEIFYMIRWLFGPHIETWDTSGWMTGGVEG